MITTFHDADMDAVHRALGGYLAAVAAELGVGSESTTVDLDTPLSAYIALDTDLADHPGRDTALLWDERHGWSLAVETHSGEDLITVDHLFATTVAPAPTRVARFVSAARRGHRTRHRVTTDAVGDDAGDLLSQLSRHLHTDDQPVRPAA